MSSEIMKGSGKFVQLTVNSWDVAKWVTSFGPWLFRGQADSSWDLSTSLERSARQFGIPIGNLENREKWILSEFQRRAHLYIPSPPPIENTVEWLALLQHHGGPTRLLDFSSSFYVASFFALEQSISDAVVWGVNRLWLMQAIREITNTGAENEFIHETNARHLQLADEFMQGKRPPTSLVLPITPYRLTERLSAQQGFLSDAL